ncbi:hypothetical protein [Bradyrhizobium sp.]|uniref:hypothetical protein n=1 Tax=Bradyrhizobium sp. TaxID=376 RepID=UPI00260AE176|nr:hypothetical protein [Bradyrhizobium sp.]
MANTTHGRLSAISLTEMRGLLETVQVVVDRLRAGDMKQVAQAARASDLAAADASPALMARLPLEFKQLGLSVRKRFDEPPQPIRARSASSCSRVSARSVAKKIIEVNARGIRDATEIAKIWRVKLT